MANVAEKTETVTLAHIADGIWSDSASRDENIESTDAIDNYAEACGRNISMDEAELIQKCLRDFAAYDGQSGQNAWHQLVVKPLDAYEDGETPGFHTDDIDNKAAREAVRQSMRQTEIVTLTNPDDLDEVLVSLSVASEGQTAQQLAGDDYYTVAEFWGDGEDGDEWRVHVRY